MGTPHSFDPLPLVALYAPYGEECSGLASKLAEIHRLTTLALYSVDQRLDALRSISSALASFGLGSESISEHANAVDELATEDRGIQNIGAKALAQCLVALDLIMAGQGALPDQRSLANSSAMALCLDALPERSRQAWRGYCEQVILVMATGVPPAPRNPGPRL